jgi:hypothetical protein
LIAALEEKCSLRTGVYAMARLHHITPKASFQDDIVKSRLASGEAAARTFFCLPHIRVN